MFCKNGDQTAFFALNKERVTKTRKRLILKLEDNRLTKREIARIQTTLEKHVHRSPEFNTQLVRPFANDTFAFGLNPRPGNIHDPKSIPA